MHAFMLVGKPVQNTHKDTHMYVCMMRSGQFQVLFPRVHRACTVHTGTLGHKHSSSTSSVVDQRFSTVHRMIGDEVCVCVCVLKRKE